MQGVSKGFSATANSAGEHRFKKNEVVPISEKVCLQTTDRTFALSDVVNNVYYFKRSGKADDADRLHTALSCIIDSQICLSDLDEGGLEHCHPRLKPLLNARILLREKPDLLGSLGQALSLGCRKPLGENHQDNRPSHALALQVLERMKGMHLARGFYESEEEVSEIDEYVWRTVLHLGRSTGGDELLKGVSQWPPLGTLPESYRHDQPFDMYLRIAGQWTDRYSWLSAHPVKLINELGELANELLAHREKAEAADDPSVLAWLKSEYEDLCTSRQALCAVQAMVRWPAENGKAQPTLSQDALYCLRKKRCNLSPENELTLDRLLAKCPDYVARSAEKKPVENKKEKPLLTAVKNISSLFARNVLKQGKTPFQGMKLSPEVLRDANESDILAALGKHIHALEHGDTIRLSSHRVRGIELSLIKFGHTVVQTPVQIFPTGGIKLKDGVTYQIEHAGSQMRLKIISNEENEVDLGAAVGVRAGVGHGCAALGAGVRLNTTICKQVREREKEATIWLPACDGKEIDVNDKSRFSDFLLKEIFDPQKNKGPLTCKQLLLEHPDFSLNFKERKSTSHQHGIMPNGFIGAFVLSKHAAVGMGIAASGSLQYKTRKTQNGQVKSSSDEPGIQTSSGWDFDKNANMIFFASTFGLINAHNDRKFKVNVDVDLMGTEKPLFEKKSGPLFTVRMENGRMTKAAMKETVRNKDAFINSERQALQASLLTERDSDWGQSLSQFDEKHDPRLEALSQIELADSNVTAIKKLDKTEIDKVNRYLSLAEQAKKANNHRDARRYQERVNTILERMQTGPVTQYAACTSETYTDEAAINFQIPYMQSKLALNLRDMLPVKNSRQNTFEKSRKHNYDPSSKNKPRNEADKLNAEYDKLYQEKLAYRPAKKHGLPPPTMDPRMDLRESEASSTGASRNPEHRNKDRWRRPDKTGLLR